jgi:hypothetical protein
MGNEGWGLTQINEAQGGGEIVKNRFRRAQTPHSLLGYSFAGVRLCSIHLKKNPEPKRGTAKYPRTVGTTAQNKVLHQLPHMYSTIFISQFQRKVLRDSRLHVTRFIIILQAELA